MAAVVQEQANVAEVFAFARFMARRARDHLDELLDLARVMMADIPKPRASEPALAQMERASGTLPPPRRAG